MQAKEIIERKFSRAFRGYDIGEVDAFLDEILRDQERMEQAMQLFELRNKMLLDELARANPSFLDNDAPYEENAQDTSDEVDKGMDNGQDASQESEESIENEQEPPQDGEESPEIIESIEIEKEPGDD